MNSSRNTSPGATGPIRSAQATSERSNPGTSSARMLTFNLLMVVDDLYIVGVAISPDEADAPLVVDADAILSGSIAH
jgi:hypothetical protein